MLSLAFVPSVLQFHKYCSLLCLLNNTCLNWYCYKDSTLSKAKIYYYVELPLDLCLWDAKIIIVHKLMLETNSKSVAALLLSSMTSNFWEFIKNWYCILSSWTLPIESMCVRESQHLNIFPLHIKISKRRPV